jgi:O-glycosyl hydrolase
MKNQGVPLYAISFQNEPDYCHNWACMTADEIYNYTKGYADQLRKHGTKVISAESFAYQKNQYDKVLQDGTALKNWDILGAHFYASSAKAKDNFFQYDLADQKKVERWMTEHYTESQGSGNDRREMRWTGDQANPNVYDTVRAIDVGYEIHRGLAIGNFSQYTWWYIKRCYGLIMAANTNTSSPHPVSIPQGEINKVSKRGYVLSQYARFVRPGAIRVGATINPEPEVSASAY